MVRGRVYAFPFACSKCTVFSWSPLIKAAMFFFPFFKATRLKYRTVSSNNEAAHLHFEIRHIVFLICVANPVLLRDGFNL